MSKDRLRVYVDMDNVLVDFPSAFNKLTEETLTEYEGRLDEVPNIFSLMEPMDGAIEAFNELCAICNTYILSTAPWENPSAWSDKLLWVKKYLGQGAYKRLVLSHNKHLNAGDYLIDDRTANGADKFKGVHIHFGTEQYPNWNAVMKHMRHVAAGGLDINNAQCLLRRPVTYDLFYMTLLDEHGEEKCVRRGMDSEALAQLDEKLKAQGFNSYNKERWVRNNSGEIYFTKRSDLQ